MGITCDCAQLSPPSHHPEKTLLEKCLPPHYPVKALVNRAIIPQIAWVFQGLPSIKRPHSLAEGLCFQEFPLRVAKIKVPKTKTTQEIANFVSSPVYPVISIRQSLVLEKPSVASLSTRKVLVAVPEPNVKVPA